MIVYVEKKVLEDPAISGDENFGAITKKFCTFREGTKISCGPFLHLFPRGSGSGSDRGTFLFCRSRRHLQLRGLHHLPRWRWNSALRFVALPGPLLLESWESDCAFSLKILSLH